MVNDLWHLARVEAGEAISDILVARFTEWAGKLTGMPTTEGLNVTADTTAPDPKDWSLHLDYLKRF